MTATEDLNRRGTGWSTGTWLSPLGHMAQKRQTGPGQAGPVEGWGQEVWVLYLSSLWVALWLSSLPWCVWGGEE